ncbi:redoxin family protein [Micromonospora inaquosa]|uniref:redoxin family protein n=1 Tax=Micromonospora inaquosa TaxID=2203716 RepID=UPI0013150CE8|nr:redoxin family protein [Micromonospora inaquosa]
MFNTAVLVAVVRRLRIQSELLSETEARGVPARALPVGATVGDFLAYDTEGRAVTAAMPAHTLIGFFSPTCGSCRRERGRFRRAAARWPGGRSQVVAVVTGPDASARFLSRLTAVARIVVDQDESVRHAFGVQGFPAAFVVADLGRLTWTGLHVDVVPGLAEEPVTVSPGRPETDSPTAV